MKVLVAGELNPDLILQNYSQFPTLGKEILVEDMALMLGSSSAIAAAGLAKLGNEVAFVGRVGRDTWGDFCVDRLKALGVDTQFIIRDSSVKTGLTVSVTSSQDRALITYLGAISTLRAEDIHLALQSGFDHFHVSSYYLQDALRPALRDLFMLAHSLSTTTSLDPGYDPSETWDGGIRSVLLAADVFLPNEVELKGLTGEEDVQAGLKQLENGKTLTVAKLGANGASVLWKGSVLHVDALQVKPVDTTGAGDSFNAGFLHSWLRQQPIASSLAFGCACGALSTLGSGGTGAQPTEEEAFAFMRAQ